MLRLFNQGQILGADGERMSKSRGNVQDPDELVARYGADSVRLFLMFMGPWDQGGPWSPTGIWRASLPAARVDGGPGSAGPRPMEPTQPTAGARLTHPARRPTSCAATPIEPWRRSPKITATSAGTP